MIGKSLPWQVGFFRSTGSGGPESIGVNTHDYRSLITDYLISSWRPLPIKSLLPMKWGLVNFANFFQYKNYLAQRRKDAKAIKRFYTII